MRRIWVLLALLAAAAVVGLYVAGGGTSERATPAGRAAAADRVEEALAPEAPPASEPENVALVVVRDTDGKAVAGATVGRFVDSKFEGGTVMTGADGRCRLTLPKAEPTGDLDDAWFAVAVRHPDFVQEQTGVRAGPEEHEVVLERGARLTVLVRDPTRKPVEGAKVTATFERRHGASGFWQWTDTNALAECVTDATGTAAMGAVPTVTVRIWVDREPFALNGSTVDVTGTAPVEHVVVLDGGAVVLGRVVAPGGEGVPGATVRFQEIGRPTATTGPSGEFRLEGVPAYTLTLVAGAQGFGPGFFGAALGWGQPVPIPIRSGATMEGLEIVLSKPTFVTGRIVDDAGLPVADVGVGAWIQRAFALGEQVKSDADGKFRVGPFSVREPGGCWAWFSSSSHTIEQVTKPAEPGRDVDFGEIKATRCGTIRGILVDEAGSGVQGRVSVDFTGSRAMTADIASKPDGTFEVSRLAPGEVALSGRTAEAPLLRSRPASFQLTAGQSIDGVRIVLLPTKPIRGRVITPDGKPRPGVILGVRPAGGAISEVQAKTNADGVFGFPDLADGEYDVGLLRSLWVREERAFLEAPAPVTVSTGREDLEFILPIKGGIVTGKVVAKSDGRPLKAFTASFLRYKLFIPSDSDWESFRDENGEFRYETDEPGTWQVDISADGLASLRTEKFSLSAGEVKDLGTIRLGPGGTIAGTVLDAQQRPVPYARINILNEKLQTNDDEPFTDLEGRFEVKGVSPGPFTVFAVSPRHPLGMVRNVDVREGERTDVHIAFVEPAPLTVDVRDTSGQPVEGAALDFTFPAVAPLTSKLFRGKIPPGYGSHKSDANGTILQPCLPPGEVTITIEMKGFEPVTKKLDLKPGEANRVEIRLRRMGP